MFATSAWPSKQAIKEGELLGKRGVLSSTLLAVVGIHHYLSSSSSTSLLLLSWLSIFKCLES